MKIGIGIDTGGTYTDAAAYDFEANTILGTAKALTTPRDLTVGILNALDALPPETIRSAGLIALSTTLATNACVEDRGGKAKLIFFGGHKKTIDDAGASYGLPPSDEMLLQEAYTTFAGETEREPDWNLFKASIAQGFDRLDGVGIIESNAIKNSAVVEKKAREIFAKAHGIPAVCGHELFNELNVLKRGAGTLLNARLFPVIRKFISSIKKAMLARNITAEIVIVRSDGSMMSEEFAHVRPVETLLCGPAASVMGSAYLSRNENSIVIDMGGTTTDIALIKNGMPLIAKNGISIGRWRTFVNGLYIKTFGLGGDTAVHYKDGRPVLEDYRVIPLCAAAAEYPSIEDNIAEMFQTVKQHSKFLHEHFMLIHDIADNPDYTDDERRLCDALADGPLPVKTAAGRVPGRDLYSLNVTRLVKEGVIAVCGLTPTDIMHLKGDFNKFSKKASKAAAEFVASNACMPPEKLCDWVYGEIKQRLYVNIVKALMELSDETYQKKGVPPEAERLIANKMPCGYYSMKLTTDFSLTGIGAPIHIFLDDVAKMLGTKAVIPPHYSVANALGAVVGQIYAEHTVEIRPQFSAAGITGYVVSGEDETRSFQSAEEAQKFAEAEAKKTARMRAVERGAKGIITIVCETETNDAPAKDGTVYLGSRITARANCVW